MLSSTWEYLRRVDRCSSALRRSIGGTVMEDGAGRGMIVASSGIGCSSAGCGTPLCWAGTERWAYFVFSKNSIPVAIIYILPITIIIENLCRMAQDALGNCLPKNANFFCL